MAATLRFGVLFHRHAAFCMAQNYAVMNIQVRMKYYDPKFRKLRAKKVIKVNLPDYDALRHEEKMSPEEIRAKLKEKGIAPPRQWNERPIFLSSTGAVVDPYIPPEGDGKVSFISRSGMKQKYGVFEKKSKSYLALRKIRNFEYDFDVPSLAEKAKQIYIEAHEALVNKDEEKLHDLATEKCFQEMMEHVKNKSLFWKFVQSLELPHVVHIRCEELLTKNNVFAQATVRLHSQQSLAIYDRFGRLMHGDENKVKDILEYVVFEKHLSNAYGSWRIHAKIIPDWMPPKDNILKTVAEPLAEKCPGSESSSNEITLTPKENNSTPATI